MAQLAHHDGVTVEDLSFEGKFSLRCRPEDQSAISAALGLDLPQTVGSMVRSETRQIICLGPDEWMVLCSEEDRSVLTDAMANTYETTVHSLVDVSFREVGLSISGPDAVVLLSTSCPRDLRVIEPGSGTRTIFDSAQVILIRDGVDSFRMYVWRSFYPHVRGLLSAAESELSFGL